MKYSYSSIATFKQCPAKFKFAYLDRVKVERAPPSPAMERGSRVHDSIETYLNGGSEFLHPDIHKSYGQFMFGLRENEKDLRPEYKWGITWEYEPCDYDDEKCMLHGFVDLLTVPDKDKNLGLYEWKTGKTYPAPHASQVHKYSVAMMCHFPDHPGVDAMITYLDQVDYKTIMYPRTMMFEYKPMLRIEIGAVSDATRFPTMPGFKCKWCQFSRDNGGPCKF